APTPLKKALGAEIAYHQNDFEEASRLGIEALQTGGEDLYVLNVLGRTYMRLRYFDQAMAFFDRARRLSPNNIERLCELAEVQAETGNHQAADQHLNAAAGIDGTNVKVDTVKAKVSIARGDAASAKTLMSKMDSIAEIVAFMNNRAISLVNQNK